MNQGPKRQRVVIVGGGVGGLTAAHELIERDFEVVVYERRDFLGGKAASVRVDPETGLANGNEGSVEQHRLQRPGEHGFRFFPGWYRHLPDTMQRIRLGGQRESADQRTVRDHLVPTQYNLLVQYGRAPVPLVLHSPKSLNQAQFLLNSVRQLSGMGLPLRDVVFFLRRLAAFLRTPIEVREQEYDRKSWWEFLDVSERSEAFRSLTIATTRTLLAAKAEEASANTIALMAIRTLFNSPLTPDYVLDGPTSEVWIHPWVSYLRGRGVQFRTNFELESLVFDGKAPEIRSLRFVSNRQLVRGRLLGEVLRASDAEETAAAEARRKLRASERLAAAEGSPAAARRGAHPAEPLYQGMQLGELKATAQRHVDELPAPEVVEEHADFYVFAMPVEQIAYYVNRSTTLKSYAPELRKVVTLAGSLDWMAGIQFYLRYPVNLPQGHIVCADSEWALTAIEQTQFWKDVAFPQEIRSIISVDISAWDKKGRFLRKEAFLCKKDEIAREVWEQLKASFNKPCEPDVLRDDALIGGDLREAYHIDDSVVDRYDRKKQAAFANGLDRALYRMQAAALGSDDLLAQASESSDAPFVFGDRLELNVEPLLVNRPRYLALRPAAKTKITNLLLAGDYVATATNLACMEGANEAARHAVNEILEAVGSKYDRCKTWRFEDGETLARLAALLSFVERLPGAGTSIEAATGAVTALGSLAARATDNFKQLWRRNVP